jgi:hypothetical protein
MLNEEEANIILESELNLALKKKTQRISFIYNKRESTRVT